MGEALALATAMSYAASNVLVRLAARRVGGDRLAAPSWAFQVEVMLHTTWVNVALLWAAWAAAALARPLLPARPLALGLSPAGLLAFAAAGVTGPFLARIVLYQGLAHVGPGRLAAGKVLSPAMAAVLAAVTLGEPLGAGLGLALALIGVGTLLTVGGPGGLPRVDLQGFLYGAHSAWWLAVAALFRRVGVLALPDALLGAALGSTVALLLVLAAARRGTRTLPTAGAGPAAGASPAAGPPAAGAPDPLRSPAVQRSILASGLLSTIALFCSIAALAHAPVAPVMAIHHTEPALAQWLGHAVLGGTDRVRPSAAVGTLMVLAGALLV